MRSRRTVAETGSFGKSTRRSRSRTGTPAARGRENPTLAAADKLFGDWVSSKQAAAAAATPDDDEDGPTTQQQTQTTQTKANKKHHQPVEIILRGYRSQEQQYASISHYEDLAGPILEDYARNAPANQRKFQSSLRDRALTRHRALTPDERVMVNRTDGGEHWVKVTFECAEAAEAALYASPQRIMGCMVHAEPYRGVPPPRDEAVPEVDENEGQHNRSKSVPGAFGTPKQRSSGGFPISMHSRLNDLNNNSPSNSQVSSQTIETGTLSSATATDLATPNHSLRVSGGADGAATGSQMLKEDDVFCRTIPTARRAVLLPAEQALRPQQSFIQRFLAAIPFLAWFSGSIIGNEVPRTDTGDFDWKRASLYWKLIWWLDATFRLFQGDIYANDKED